MDLGLDAYYLRLADSPQVTTVDLSGADVLLDFAPDGSLAGIEIIGPNNGTGTMSKILQAYVQAGGDAAHRMSGDFRGGKKDD